MCSSPLSLTLLKTWLCSLKLREGVNSLKMRICKQIPARSELVQVTRESLEMRRTRAELGQEKCCKAKSLKHWEKLKLGGGGGGEGCTLTGALQGEAGGERKAAAPGPA